MKLGPLKGGTRLVTHTLLPTTTSEAKCTEDNLPHLHARSGSPVASLPPPPLTFGPLRQRALAVWAPTTEATFPCLHYKKHKTITGYECIHIWDTLSNSWPPSRSLGMRHDTLPILKLVHRHADTNNHRVIWQDVVQSVLYTAFRHREPQIGFC